MSLLTQNELISMVPCPRQRKAQGIHFQDISDSRLVGLGRYVSYQLKNVQDLLGKRPVGHLELIAYLSLIKKLCLCHQCLN